MIVTSVVPTMWVLVRLVRNCWRGLDFTDEGMYLLSADSQSRLSSFHNAFGRYTRVLYRLAGFDVGRFRAAGLFLLVFAAATAGNQVVSTAQRLTGKSVPYGVRCASVCGVVSGTLAYYTLMLLTPSYNMLNLIGLLLLIAGVCGLVSDYREPVRGKTQTIGVDIVWLLTCVVGTTIATMGKISSLAIGVLFIGTSVTRTRMRSSRRNRTIWGILVVAGIALAHSLFVNPLGTTVRQIARGQSGLELLDPAYGLGAAISSVGDAMREIATKSFSVVGVALIFPLVVQIFERKSTSRSAYRIEVAFALALVTAAVRVHSLSDWNQGHPPLSAVSWIGVSMVLLSLAALGRAARTVTVTGGRHALVSFYILLICFLAAGAGFAFGSNNGFFVQLSGGVGLLVLAAVFMLLVAHPGQAGILAVTLVLSASLFAYRIVVKGELVPYRQEPLATQTVPVSIGPRGGSLALSANTARFVADIRREATKNGWQPGTRLLDLSAYAASVLYLLEAKPPLTIIPSVCCYSGQNDLARWSLAQAVEADGKEVWRRAWLLTLDVPKNKGVDVEILSKIDRSLSKDYKLVGTFPLETRGEVLSLWKPTA
jgi:hypothetical protein